MGPHRDFRAGAEHDWAAHRHARRAIAGRERSVKALLIVLDSVGVGGAPDAAEYGDDGADTLGHICAATGLRLPIMESLGLARIRGANSPAPRASWGVMQELSKGKDSTTGHWEIAGVVLEQPFRSFERFPDELVAAIEQETSERFVGNRPASGTGILDELGPRHLQTGELILYTSADSVLQIAAHEGVVPVERLYEICRIARRHADAYDIGRVIARPFIGEPGAFLRTSHRHDFSARPPRTVLDAICERGLPVVGIGKTGDLFDHRGFTRSVPTESNAHGVQEIERAWTDLREGLVFANLVDFDTVYGHRRDVTGYARALREFDDWLGTFLPCVTGDDVLMITADHGNDPTFGGTDHTRERVPLLFRFRDEVSELGLRSSFADIAATLAVIFGLDPWPVGCSFAGQGLPALA